MPGRPYLSVIIPFHNVDRDLELCLQHLAASDFSDFECLLVDDGSVRPAPAKHQWPLPVQVLRNSANLGPAVARNLGGRMAKGAVLVFLDADVCVRPETLARLAARFADQDLGAVFGSYDDSPAVVSVTSQFRNLLHCYTHQANPKRAETFWAGCGAIRREIFLEHGGFSERYPRPSIEDIEFGGRLAAAGVKIEIDREIQVQHCKDWTLASMCRTDIFSRGIPWTRLVLERRSMPNQLSLRYEQRFSVLFTWASVLSLASVPSHPTFPLVWAASWIIILGLNRQFYSFLARRRGLLFTTRAFGLHLLYFFNCGLALGLGIGAHCIDRLRRPDKNFEEIRSTSRLEGAVNVVEN